MSKNTRPHLTLASKAKWLNQHGVEWCKMSLNARLPWVAADVRDLENVRILGKWRTWAAMIEQLYDVHF